MFKAIAAAVALAIAGTQVSAETFTPRGARAAGGVLTEFEAHVIELNERGISVRLDMPTCTSACTFYLVADDVCVGPDSLFKFHGPSNFFVTMLFPFAHGMEENNRAVWIEYMRAIYAHRWPALGDWFVENAADKFGVSTVDVRGQSLHDAFGIPLCSN